ncbi:MAG: glycosyltransferase [Polyangiaceae bacterium]
MTGLSISVVVATYQRAQLLPSLLQSLSAQTVPASEFELVLIDDGSTTPARAVVEAHPVPYRLQLIEQANTGQAAARHRGVLAASGDIIVIVDDDMRLAPDFLERHRSWHEQGYRVALGRIESSSDLERMPLFERFHARNLEKAAAAFARGKQPRGVNLCSGNVSFRREDYLAVGGFDASLKRSEDRDLGVRLELHGAKFAFAHDASSEHNSDHASLEVWLRRAFNYGVYDLRIHRKYPQERVANPWSYLFVVNPVSRPLLLLAVAAPRVGGLLSNLVWKVSSALDDAGLEKPALSGATLVYGLEYFRGVREESGSVGKSASGLWRCLRSRDTQPSPKH